MKKWLIKSVVLLVLVGVAGLALWTWGSLTYVYSSGERAGYIQKFSKKGWLFKTWEGELAMVNLPGTMPEIFYFTVRNDGVAKEINAVVGSRVALDYDEHRGIPSKIFGDTPHFVTGVRVIEPAKIN